MKQSSAPKKFIGFQTALESTLKTIKPLDVVARNLAESIGFVCAEKLHACVDSPSVDVSMKDGFAVNSSDVSGATPEKPVRLALVGITGAGQKDRFVVAPGTAVRILTGARIPEGADTIVAEELTAHSTEEVSIYKPAELGYNILAKGSDVARGEIIVQDGSFLTPGNIGLLAAGGIESVRVYRRPRVALIATGDEMVLPGQPLSEGSIYASNLLTLHAWCRRFKMITGLDIAPDKEDMLKEKLFQMALSHDALITSGGAWTGDRDLMEKVLNALGWKMIYHHVRLGPGKAVGFGMLNEKPVFILPGGPPSNLVAFLQLALPGLLKLSGYLKPGLPQITAMLEETLEGQNDWTQAIFGFLKHGHQEPTFRPANSFSRLKNMADAQALLLIPEGVSSYRKGEVVSFQMLR
ncbi:MAG: molybdopterin molybdotransferase MoeA [Desulfobacterales bacterium]|nr:MAG: molybdopterin molybdotransferase MoeA [Desulfobacterales bacterium]